MKLRSLLFPLFVLSTFTGFAQEDVSRSSVFTTMPHDSQAVSFTQDHFAIHADGVGDDSAALQAAIDQVSETTSYGVVFIPEGTYRFTSGGESD